MIPLFLIIAPQITGDEAVAVAKKALKAFDVQGPLRLQGLGGRYENGDQSAWNLKFSTPKLAYRVAITDEGRVRYIEPSDFGGPRDRKPYPDDALKAARWMKGLDARFPVRLLPPGEFGGSTFFYRGLVKGLPVVYPRTSLGYIFRLESGVLLSFVANDVVPTVGSPVAKLTEADALAAFERIFKAENPPHAGLTFSYRLSGPRELGWVLPEGGGPVKLAWRIPFDSFVETQLGTKGGSSGMLVDANTGERIKTQYSP